MNEKTVHICNWCNQKSFIIWVHGHGQCSVCGINIDECCRGEEAADDFSEQIKSQEDSSETERN